MMPCQGCTCAAVLRTIRTVERTLADTCASPRMLSTCWQGEHSTVNFTVNEQRLEGWQVVELALPDAAELGSVGWTESMPRLAARACRARPPLASH